MSKSEKDSKKNSVQTFIASFVNCIAAIGIVLANKGALRQWKFAISLTSIHFAFTFIGLSILCILGVFQFKSLPIRRVVGFYQTMKIAITPFVCILEMIWIGKRFSLEFERVFGGFRGSNCNWGLLSTVEVDVEHIKLQ
ncbi:MAG: hypothetical protein EZS28_008589 [Streblomastix strix]|uniref:Uncharacterized protein n=1 Tax=Streblomastix strix TaxID=222440 RepID=A0A5J4WM27_9EUKA|nr:MAG: hypothetical protein EZS28_008589 [Streblomastix strix]